MSLMTMADPGPMPSFLVRLIYSYTFLNVYDKICPYQAYRRYIVKDIKFVDSPAAQWGNTVHNAFELRVGGHKPLPVDMLQWEPFAVPFDGKNVQCELKLGLTETGHPVDFWAKNVRIRTKI